MIGKQILSRGGYDKAIDQLVDGVLVKLLITRVNASDVLVFNCTEEHYTYIT